MCDEILGNAINHNTNSHDAHLFLEDFLELFLVDGAILVEIINADDLIDFGRVGGLATHLPIGRVQEFLELLGVELPVLVRVVLFENVVDYAFQLLIRHRHAY